ncbi:hypothetical protein HERIO_551 [Hepatospora eriocheir]|uniref:Transcription initiation factor IIA gamma subunit C-terminal domain-containing protein n=1 Tax=Hepatospora eriocheir TaxID=1081669 RepID=A0A1X0QD36_9MICR|nr:hypothetical protein HERIO_551 [Hepatospora eriocheir]
MDLIEDKIKNNLITEEQGRYIAAKYDDFVERFLKINHTSINFSGKILTYNFVEGVWKFVVSNLDVSHNNRMYKIPLVTIVAMESDTDKDSGRKKRKLK